MFSIKTTSRFVLILSTLILSNCGHHQVQKPKLTTATKPAQPATKTYTINHPTYGTITIDDPLAIDLIKSPTMQRIKSVHQYGISHYTDKTRSFSRYDHSIGVYFLLKKYGLSRKEQIAGLLHDASHTAFSHVAEKVFNFSDPRHSYQDTIHRPFLESQGIGSILATYGLTIIDVIHKDDIKNSGRVVFTALEQDLPDMCADRIDYNIEGAVFEDLISKKEAQEIVAALRWGNGTWYFTDVEIAKKFAAIPLYLTQYTWSSASSNVVYTWAGEALRRAFDIGLITKEEFHTSTDDAVGAKLNASQDPIIKDLMHKITHEHDFYQIGDENNFDVKFKAKFRGIDPFVQTERGLERLTKLDPAFAQQYNAVKEHMARGVFVKYKGI